MSSAIFAITVPDLFGQDADSPNPLMKHLLLDAPVTMLEGVELRLYEAWDRLPHGQIKTKQLTTKTVRFKARFHDVRFLSVTISS